MMAEGGIARQITDDYVLVTVERPPVNALETVSITALQAAFTSAPKNLPVVLTGTGKSFCAGVDTRAFAAYNADEKAEMIRAITRMTAAVLAHSAPVIAAMNGHALGGGLVLALACDVRLVSDTTASRFGLPEARAGVPFPAGPLEVIRHEVAPGLLRRLTLTSETISTADLIAHNLADKSCSPETLLPEAIKLAKDVAAQPAFQQVKHQMRGGLIDAVTALAESGEDAYASALIA